MARSKKQKPEKSKKPEAGIRHGVSPDVGFSSLNIKLLILSVFVIVVGFVFLSQGSVTLAPILLVLGYCVLVPISIIYKPRSKS
jgi:hypothetical protein